MERQLDEQLDSASHRGQLAKTPQSGEYSLFDTVWPPTPASALKNAGYALEIFGKIWLILYKETFDNYSMPKLTNYKETTFSCLCESRPAGCLKKKGTNNIPGYIRQNIVWLLLYKFSVKIRRRLIGSFYIKKNAKY